MDKGKSAPSKGDMGKPKTVDKGAAAKVAAAKNASAKGGSDKPAAKGGKK